MAADPRVKVSVVRWTPVTEGYPPPYSPCLAVADGVLVVGTVFEWHPGQRKWQDYSGKRPEVRQDVTHWAEMIRVTVADGYREDL